MFYGDENGNNQSKTQEQRIQDLEMKLSLVNQQLRDERTVHTNALRREKERAENTIQDLQLRLYISETRLKTYQDALEQHVQSVAANVSSNYTPSSPTRKRRENDTPSSPLISKVLMQTTRMGT